MEFYSDPAKVASETEKSPETGTKPGPRQIK